jgi:hypothetical protein
MKGSDEHIKAAMVIALQEAWAALDDSFFYTLAESMCDRVAALLKAKGWHTKY